jgi:hypothetical protein
VAETLELHLQEELLLVFICFFTRICLAFTDSIHLYHRNLLGTAK